MANEMTIESRYKLRLAELSARGQEHVFRFWRELDSEQREHLLTDLETIPWSLMDGLIETHVLGRPEHAVLAGLSPAKVYPQCPAEDQKELYAEAVETGRELLGNGKVAAFTVAGGQGTRLGFDGPKGALEVTPVGSRTLFQLFAETIVTARRRYDTPIPWYLMTSPSNHGETVAFFEGHDYFGLPKRDVIFFVQGMLPVLDPKGRLLLAAKDHLALAPDGHGGSLKAMVASGALGDMGSRGVEIISYFQIDNPLVKPFDPLFVGLHSKTGSEMSTKVTPKADDLERVGNFCVHEGKVKVVEYSDFPEDLAHARNADGSRRFDAGNLAIHLIDVALVERVAGEARQLPFRRADKAVAFVAEDGSLHEPTSPNAVKLETFVFDVLDQAKHPLLLEVDRAEEFSPIKNASGADSLETSQRAQVARACRWLEDAGVEIPRTPDGQPDVTVVIAPTVALDAQDVGRMVDRLPKLEPGDVVSIE